MKIPIEFSARNTTTKMFQVSLFNTVHFQAGWFSAETPVVFSLVILEIDKEFKSIPMFITLFEIKIAKVNILLWIHHDTKHVIPPLFTIGYDPSAVHTSGDKNA